MQYRGHWESGTKRDHVSCHDCELEAKNDPHRLCPGSTRYIRWLMRCRCRCITNARPSPHSSDRSIWTAVYSRCTKQQERTHELSRPSSSHFLYFLNGIPKTLSPQLLVLACVASLSSHALRRNKIKYISSPVWPDRNKLREEDALLE